MIKRLVFIWLAVSLNLLILRFYEADTREPLPQSPKKNGLTVVHMKEAFQSNIHSHARVSEGLKVAEGFKASTSDDHEGGAMVELFNRLLAADRLDEIMDHEWKYASSMCRKHLNRWSDLACEADNHYQRLMIDQDDRDLPMANDWKWVEEIGGGTENSEVGESVLLKHDLFSQDSLLDGDLDSTVVALTDKAFLAQSSEIRQQALERAIMSRSEAYLPLFLELSDDLDPVTRALATEGLRQLQVYSGKLTETLEVQEQF